MMMFLFYKDVDITFVKKTTDKLILFQRCRCIFVYLDLNTLFYVYPCKSFLTVCYEKRLFHQNVATLILISNEQKKTFA